MAKRYIAVFNAGSATLKFKVYDRRRIDHPVVHGEVERIGLPKSFIVVNGRSSVQPVANHRAAIRLVLKKLEAYRADIEAIGHRVVHGGQTYDKPTIVTPAVAKRLRSLRELAPLHNPKSLDCIEECRRQLSHIRNVAVFDTALFHGIPDEYSRYALPRSLEKRLGIRKFGFHGISHGYAAEVAAIRLHKRLSVVNLLTVHLGNGCSIAAFHHGHAVNNSFGFTPTAGLIMGTRTGDLDPIIPLYMQKKLHVSPDRVEHILNTQSGLLGLSGFSSDMREILKAAGYPVTGYVGRASFTAEQRKNAKLALHVFISRLRLYVSAYAGLLGRVHAIVFTGSMGERSAVIRRLVVKNLPELRHVPVIVVPADEELAIARTIASGV